MGFIVVVKAKPKVKAKNITGRGVTVVKIAPSYYLSANIITEINYILDGKSKELGVYFELLEQIDKATSTYGKCFDSDFILKVNPEKDWSRYLNRWLRENTLRRAWRLWQCVQAMDIKIKSEEILRFIDDAS